MRHSFSPWDNLRENLRVKTAASSDLFRKLPSVDEIMRGPAIAALAAAYGHEPVVDAARVVLTRLRQEITTGLLDHDALELALSGLAGALEKQVRQALRYSLRPVINATGVILHTNLGRAPLGEEAIEHIRETAASYSNLEFDVDAGVRGKRDVHVDRLFRKLLSEGDTAHIEAAASPPKTATIVVN